MKKHQIVAVVGTIALAANLLLPSLAFGQGQGQQANQDIGCPPAAGTQTFANTPVTTNLTSITAGVVGNSVDMAVSGNLRGTSVKGDNLLAITDTTSRGANGCSTVGGSVTASAENFTDSAGDFIPSGTLRLVTTPNVTADLTSIAVFGSSPVPAANVIYNHGPGVGDAHDVVASQTVADPLLADLGNTIDLSTYRLADPNQNLLGSGIVPIDVMIYCTPKYSTFGTDVLLALEGVPASQESGSYHTTVTYTKAPKNCSNLNAKTLTASIDALTTTITLNNTGSIAVNTILVIGVEYVKVTDVNIDGVTLTVTRGQLGSITAPHYSGSIVNHVGTVQTAAPLTADILASDTVLPVASVTPYSVGQTIIFNDAGYDHAKIIVVTPGGSPTITVDRNADNTTAAPHLTGTELVTLDTFIP